MCAVGTWVLFCFCFLARVQAENSGVYMDTVMLGVNNGPNPYRPDLGDGNVLVGGISPQTFSSTNTTTLAEIYR